MTQYSNLFNMDMIDTYFISQWNASQNKYDNWYIGYNNDIVSAVWIGYDDNTKLSSNQYKYGQNIWFNSVESYESGKSNEEVWYDVPSNVSAVFVEPISGKPVTDDNSKKKLMYFLKGTEPRTTDQVFDEIASNQMAT